MKRLLLLCFTAITFFFAPIAVFASAADLSPSVLDLNKDFSERFCRSIRNGITPERAGETAASQLLKGVFFLPVMNEIISAAKEDLAASLSDNIFNECGNGLGGTKEELDYYLLKLAKKIPTKSSQALQFPSIRQKPSK